MKLFLQNSLFLILIFFPGSFAGANADTTVTTSPGIAIPGPGGQWMQAVILLPADSVIDGHAVLKVMPQDEPVGKLVYQLFRESYMHNAVVFYYLAQHYLVNTGKLQEAKPAYLLLSQNQGGFPRFGFYLQQGDSLLDMTSVPYIELVKNNPNPEDRVGSMTQIYPHEMGHIIYHLLSEDTDTIIPAAVDIHFASMTTDYQTAFNEGFAMHFESMARIHEPDEDRKAAIVSDLEEKKGKVGRKIDGYKRDFTWPLRPGFYRMSMLTWYQVLEDIKRNEWVTDFQMKYENESRLFSNPEKSLYYRNSGIGKDSVIRLPQRAFATEGVIASFFSGLLHSEAGQHYQEAEFYRSFLPAGDSVLPDKEVLFDPIENQYMKIFAVMHRHINQTITTQSQFVDFVTAYIHDYPEEKSLVTTLFKRATGLDYPPEAGRELWLINPDHEHGVLVMEQFGGITVPFYTFNLNAATEADLLTFDAIKEADAGRIINHLKEKGPFETLADLDRISGLTPGAVDQLKGSPFDPQFLKDLDESGITLSISSLLTSYVKQLLLIWLLYGSIAILLGLMIQHKIFRSIRYKTIPGLFLRFLVFLLFALASIVLTHLPLLYFTGMLILITGITFLILRSKESRQKLLITTAPMLLVLVYALI